MLSWISWVFIPCICSSKFWCCSITKERSQSQRTNAAPTGCAPTHHLVHEGDEAPEGLHLAVHHGEDGRQQVAHALDVA